MLGCYADSASAHTLTSFSSTSNAQTVEMCKFTCSNYLFYGLSGNTCYCGNTISNGGTLQPSAGSCNINCAGNTAQICGGSSSISLYGPSSTWNYAGCYGDASSTRPLAAVWVNSAYSGMTVENCQSYCGANNYTFAGLEYGMECYCGNTISSSSPQLPAASCQTKMRCTGSAAESCGAGNMMDIYTSKKNYVASALPTSKTWTPYGSGCYTDSNNLRSITNGVRLINDLNNSPSLCQTQCGSLGYKYAGLEYSQECWCSNSLNSIISRMSATAGSCSMPCTGSSSTCGGVGYMQLYQS